MWIHDAHSLRFLTSEILRCNGEEALKICLDENIKLDLMITDMIMPRIGGRELAERVRPVRPQLKILFTSGYTDDDVFCRKVDEDGVAFIEKPFAPDALAHKVRQVLDSKLL